MSGVAARLRGLSHKLALILALLLSMSAFSTAAAPEPSDGGSESAGSPAEPPSQKLPPPPSIPTQQELESGKAAITDFIPTNYAFRIAVIGDFTQEFQTDSGLQQQIKTPLVLINPANGNVGVYAKNFPARIVAFSTNGQWVIGVAPSTAVEGSSGSRQKESAVSLDLESGEIKLIREFALHSKFQAVFDERDVNRIFFCVNEPASENQIISYNLKTNQELLVPLDGNRFYIYGLHTVDPQGLWVQDSSAVGSDPILSLIDLKKGQVLRKVSFPGAQQVYAQPGGATLLASVANSAEASLGYFSVSGGGFHQVPKVVLTRPSFKWLNNRMAVIAKESTSTRDRFLLVDLATGQVNEIFSAYFKIAYWDVSPDDSALVFVTQSKDTPVLYVVPLDNRNTAINRVALEGITNISWLGCLYPGKSSGSGSWLSRLLPFKL